MPDANTIEVSISARTGEYVAAMKEAASTTGTTATAIQSELQGISSSASEAHAPMGAFTNIIKDYRSEVRTEGRYSRFLAGDIASMGIASKSAAGEVTMLVSALAFGGGMGVAIEGVKILVKTINEASEAAEKQAEALKKIHEGVADSIKKSMEAVRATFEDDTRTKTEKAWAAEVEKGREQLKGIDEQINKIRASSGGLRDIAHALTTDYRGMNDAFTVKGTEELIAPLQAQKDAILKTLYEGKPLVTATAVAEAAADAKKAREEDALDSAKWLASETSEYKKHYDQITAETTKFLEAKFAAEDKEALDEAKLLQDETKEYKKHYDQVTAETTRALEEQFAVEERAEKKRLEAQIQEQKKLQRAAESAAKSMGDAFGTAFSGMIQGTETAAAAFKAMAKAGLKAVIDLAIASITASAVKSEGEAFSSQAGIPIIGPALAVAAAAAAGAIVMGFLDQLPSAAGGYDIPTMNNPVVQTHGGEMILPRDIADPLRESLNGDQSGGDIHVHVHAAPGSYVDAQGIQRLPHDQNFIRGMRDARRLGRWP